MKYLDETLMDIRVATKQLDLMVNEEENKKIIKEKLYELLDLGIILNEEIVKLMIYNAIENYMEVTHRDIFYLNIEFIEGEF